METTQTLKTIYDIFESGPCSRCGGSGRMPFAVYGGLCFLCHGKGHKLSKHGQKNYDAWRAAVDAVTFAPASQMKVGDAVKLETGFARYYRIESIEIGRSHCGTGKLDETGAWIKDEAGQVITVYDDVYKVRLDREIRLPSPLGSYKQQEFEVPMNRQIRIHPGNDKMPKAEDFVTVKKVRKPKTVPAGVS